MHLVLDSIDNSHNKAINADSISVASFLCFDSIKENQLQFAGYGGVMRQGHFYE